jgi:hypothetical protein
LAAAVTAVTCLLGGCSSDQFGSELSVRPKPYALRKTESVTVRLPQDEPFSIALPLDHREPGLDGEADAHATAERTGQGEARATVTRSGTAEGLFRLGHAFANDTDRQIDLDITVRYQYEFEAREEPEARLPEASVGLRLYARDDRGRILRDWVLVSYSTDDGTARDQADRTTNCTITLGPGESVDVFLAGRAKADVSVERTASALLKLSGLQFEVVTRPAPAVRAASDEQQ